MRSNAEYVERIWRSTRLSFFVYLVVIPIIVVINIASGHERGGGTATEQLGYGILMEAAGCLVFGFCWLIFRFVRSVIEVRGGKQ